LSLRETINGTTRGDRILFIFLLIASLVAIFFVKDVLPKGNEVVIEVDGKMQYTYPLNSDRMVKVESRYGNLTVEIKGSKVRVVDASCPNKLCEHQGWVSGGAIVCLPSRISVLVGSTGKSQGGAVDATTG
jgi:hypothetical protein